MIVIFGWRWQILREVGAPEWVCLSEIKSKEVALKGEITSCFRFIFIHV